MTPELHRPLPADTVPLSGREVVVEATPEECAALAARMRIPAVKRLRVRFALTPALAGSIAAAGRIEAEVVQTCVVTLEEFTARIGEDFEVLFVEAGTESDDIDPEAVDEIPFAAGVLDLGEAAAEQLALALDPYPRAPGAVLPDAAEAGDLDLHPFARLSQFRHRQ
jgi:hypothetical protein